MLKNKDVSLYYYEGRFEMQGILDTVGVAILTTLGLSRPVNKI